MGKLSREQTIRATLLGIAVIALLLLVVGISQVRLTPGLPFEQIWAFLLSQFQRGGLTGAVPGSAALGGILVDIVRTLFTIALIAFPFAIILILLDPKLRKQVLGTLVRMLILFALLGLFVESQADELELEEPRRDMVLPQEGELPLAEPFTDEQYSPTEVAPWIVRATSLALGLVIAVVIIVVINLIRRSRGEEGVPLDEIARRARSALDEIERGGDLRNTVLRCYEEMSRVVREERGVRRDRAVTAREFTEALVRANLPSQPIQRLTRLFEKARYSTGTPTPEDEQEAVASLEAIIEACRSLT